MKKTPEPAADEETTSVALETFPTLEAPPLAHTCTLTRKTSNGGWETCRVHIGGQLHKQLPAANVTEASILELWGGGTYRAMWHKEGGKTAGRSAEITLTAPKKPADFGEAAPPPAAAAPASRVPVNASPDLAMYLQAQEHAEDRFRRREMELQREHERALERMRAEHERTMQAEDARHQRHSETERQGFQFLLQATAQAAKVAATPAGAPATDSKAMTQLARMMERLVERVEDMEPGGGDDEDTSGFERILDKATPVLAPLVTAFMARMQQQQGAPLPPAQGGPA